MAGGHRLAELLGALSLASDLADLAPPETALKHALLSVWFGSHLGLQGQDLRDVYYGAAHAGCSLPDAKAGSEIHRSNNTKASQTTAMRMPASTSLGQCARTVSTARDCRRCRRWGIAAHQSTACAGKCGEFKGGVAERESFVAVQRHALSADPLNHPECSSYGWRGFSSMRRAGPSSTTQSAKN
jgi:hypothetical protein